MYGPHYSGGKTFLKIPHLFEARYRGWESIFEGGHFEEKILPYDHTLYLHINTRYVCGGIFYCFNCLVPKMLPYICFSLNFRFEGVIYMEDLAITQQFLCSTSLHHPDALGHCSTTWVLTPKWLEIWKEEKKRIVRLSDFFEIRFFMKFSNSFENQRFWRFFFWFFKKNLKFQQKII